MFAELDRRVGLGALKAFHLNDSKTELGSRVDRHQEIGDGTLGLYPFWRLVNDPRFAELPGILETPSGPDKLPSFARNLAPPARAHRRAPPDPAAPPARAPPAAATRRARSPADQPAARRRLSAGGRLRNTVTRSCRRNRWRTAPSGACDRLREFPAFENISGAALRS